MGTCEETIKDWVSQGFGDLKIEPRIYLKRLLPCKKYLLFIGSLFKWNIFKTRLHNSCNQAGIQISFHTKVDKTLWEKIEKSVSNMWTYGLSYVTSMHLKKSG